MKTLLEIFYLANLKKNLILRTAVGFRFHNPLNTMTFALHHHQECTANSLYLMLITLNLVPSRTDPFRKEEKQAHFGDPLTRIPTGSPFESLIGGRILMLGTIWGQVCWEQGRWSQGWRRGRVLLHQATQHRGEEWKHNLLYSQERVTKVFRHFQVEGDTKASCSQYWTLILTW